jgi:hypothetical protein
MYMKFGNYTHAINDAGVSIESQPLLDASGTMFGSTETWTINWRIRNTTQDAKNLDSPVQALINAYSQDATYAAILHDDGTPTVHVLQAGSGASGPIRVSKPPSFMKFQNGEMVTYRSGTVQITATKLVSNSDFIVVEFSENLDIQKSGEVYKPLVPNTGEAIIQRTATNQPSTVTQSGTVTYLGTYGEPPDPLFTLPQSEPLKLSYGSPQKIGTGLFADHIKFPLKYTYKWIWPSDLQGLPTRWN